MTRFDNRDIYARINDLLDEEFQTLAGGKFDALASVLKKKEVLFEQIGQKSPDRELLLELKAKAERNQALLGAVEAGIRAASQRISQMLESRDGFQIYDQTGKKTDQMAARGKMARRA